MVSKQYFLLLKMFARKRNLVPKMYISIIEKLFYFQNKRLSTILLIYLILTECQSHSVTESGLFKSHWNFMLIKICHIWWTENGGTLCLPNVTKCRNAVQSLKACSIVHRVLEGITLAILNNSKMSQSSSLWWYWPRVSKAFICLQLYLLIWWLLGWKYLSLNWVSYTKMSKHYYDSWRYVLSVNKSVLSPSSLSFWSLAVL